MRTVLNLLVLLGLSGTCLCLECYVCEAQTNNRDKCIKTTIQCEQDQDACETRIMWKQPEFWQPRSKRYHYISKKCSQKTVCQTSSVQKGIKCMRDWWKDWDCVECCQGDRCNYYTTLGAGTTELSLMLLLIGFVAQYLLRQR